MMKEIRYGVTGLNAFKQKQEYSTVRSQIVSLRSFFQPLRVIGKIGVRRLYFEIFDPNGRDV